MRSTTYASLNMILNNFYKYIVEIYNHYNIVIMFKNSYELILDSHTLLLKIFNILIPARGPD